VWPEYRTRIESFVNTGSCTHSEAAVLVNQAAIFKRYGNPLDLEYFRFKADDVLIQHLYRVMDGCWIRQLHD